MTALHLYPIHNAVGIVFYPVGWAGKYSIQAMVLENGRWLTVGDPAQFPRQILESPPEGEKIVAGQFELTVETGQWNIRHRGGNFGKCRHSGLLHALENARLEATGREDGIVPDEDPRSGARSNAIPIPIDDVESDARSFAIADQ